VKEYFIQMPTDDFWGWAIVSIIACIGGFYFAFRNLARARIIEDTPTAKIRSAHQGYVELVGQAEALDGTPIVTPLTKSECCWYRYKIAKKNGKDWDILEDVTSDTPFLLRDETDACIIDPEGAEITPTDYSVWYGYSREPSDRNPPRKRRDEGHALGLHTYSGISRGNYRYSEERIYPNDTLYAIGLFKTLDDVDHHHTRQEMSRELLREWKRDTAKLRAKFDSNKDGRIDPEEWDKARQTAAAMATREHEEQLKTRTLHTLSKTESSHRPYLLSSTSQFALVRKYRLWAGGSMIAFFAGGTMATAMLTARLMGQG
jgi:hypothetical protein